MEDEILRVENLTKVFESESGRTHGRAAVDRLSFSLREGTSLGIVGESGSGKTTAARIIAGLERATEGRILLKIGHGSGRAEGDAAGHGGTAGRDFTGQETAAERDRTGQEKAVKRDPAGRKEVDLSSPKGKADRRIYRYMQMVFQTPQASFDPRQKLGRGICESLINDGMSRKDARERAEELITSCGLPKEYLDKYPHEVSGGQCQRAAIARAIANRPRLLLLDEPTSALDVTVQKQILGLLKEVREKYRMSFLFITHDLAVAQEMCDRILVMREGKKVEENTTEELIRNPQDPYTALLLESVL